MRSLFRQLPLLVLLNCLFASPRGYAQVQADPTSAWTLQLIRHPIEPYRDNVKLVTEQPDKSFAIVRDHWAEIVGSSSKQSLLVAFKMGSSPHILELLDIAASDDNPNVRYAAADALISFAFRMFKQDDRNEYVTWRQGNINLTLEQVVRREESAFFKRLDAAKSDDGRSELLNVLMRVDFASNLPVAQLRRDLGREFHALDTLARMLAKPTGPAVLELYAIRILQPDEKYLQRVVAPLAYSPNSGPVRYAAISLLSAYQSPAAVEIVTRMLTQGADSDGIWILRQALAVANDTKLIPVLIGVLEAEDDVQIDELLQYPLQKLTRTFGRELHDGGWWRLWWRRNYAKFPEVADTRIPHFKPQLRSTDRDALYRMYRMNRRQTRWCEIRGDGQRAYWLVCPGFVAGASTHEPASPRKLGLVVVLGAVGSADDLALYWAEACKSALNDGYYIAIPVAPEAYLKGGWVTAKTGNHPQGAANTFTIESFVSDVVEDVCRIFSIDRDRCYMNGVGDGGMAAYACSLAPATPFHGFYILASAFKSTQLPPLTTAMRRRYYLQSSVKDVAAPAWQVEAAGELLKRNGAIVKLASVPGNHGYKFEGDAWKPIAAAMAWLDSRK